MEQSTLGGVGACRIPSVKEVEVIEILLNLPKLISKYEILSQYSFTWGSKKRRTFLPSPLNQRPVDEGFPEKVTAAEATKSPSTPLCFLPSVGKNLKRKATVALMETYNGMQPEREFLVKEVKAMKTHHQELPAQNMEFKAKRQEINYSRSIADFQALWNNSLQHCQQYVMMDNDLIRAKSAAAAEARKRRMMKLKQNKYNSLLSLKVERGYDRGFDFFGQPW